MLCFCTWTFRVCSRCFCFQDHSTITHFYHFLRWHKPRSSEVFPPSHSGKTSLFKGLSAALWCRQYCAGQTGNSGSQGRYVRLRALPLAKYRAGLCNKSASKVSVVNQRPWRGQWVQKKCLWLGAASAGTLRGQAALTMLKDTAEALRASVTGYPSLCWG